MKVLDFRVRPPLGGFLDMILYANAERRDRITRMHGFEPAPSATAKSMDLLLAEMDGAGVTTGLLPARLSQRLGSVSNEDVVAVVSRYPGRFVGAGAVDPSDRRRAQATIESCVRSGLRAINFEPGSYAQPLHVDDRRLYPLYATCEDLDVPAVIMAGVSAGPALSSTDPVGVDRVAADFPSLRIVVSHGAWPWVHQILHVAYRRPNVYLSPDQYLANMPGMRDYVDAINGFLADRFIYGSSYPFLPVDACLAWFRSLPIRADVLPRVLHDNGAALLGLESR